MRLCKACLGKKTKLKPDHRLLTYCYVNQKLGKTRKSIVKRRGSINIRQENTGTSCLTSETGSDDIFDFTIVFCIPRNPLPEKTARINQLQAGKCCHFLFGE